MEAVGKSQVQAGKLSQISRYTPEVFFTRLEIKLKEIQHPVLVAHTSLSLLPRLIGSRTLIAFPSRIDMSDDTIFRQFDPYLEKVLRIGQTEHVTLFDDTKKNGVTGRRLLACAKTQSLPNMDLVYAFDNQLHP